MRGNRHADWEFGHTPDYQHYTTLGIQLAEKVNDLDEWIRRGGFLPQVWTLGPTAPRR